MAKNKIEVLKCAIPLDTCVDTGDIEKRGEEVRDYLVARGCTNTHGYNGNAGQHIGRSKTNNIEYASDANFTHHISYKRFLELINEPETKDNYLIFT